MYTESNIGDSSAPALARAKDRQARRPARRQPEASFHALFAAPRAMLFPLAIPLMACVEPVPEIDRRRIQELSVAQSSAAHWTDFLTPGCRTHRFPGLREGARRRCIEDLTRRGYGHFYLYAYNELDYRGPDFDFYADPQTFVARLVEIREAGLLPVVWLFPDDAPEVSAESTPELMQRLDRLVPAIDPLVDGYVLGLELDEYWGPARVDSLGQHLNTLTSKSIGVHQLPGRWDYAKFDWADLMILQYGFGRTDEEIRDLTVRAMSELRKPVVAGEYELDDESRALILGDVAVAAGAAGFGNGGTAPRRTTLPD